MHAARATAPRVAMVAGEASGDLLAGLLLKGMQARWPAMQAHGIGGPQMAQRGFIAWWPSDKLSVRGYVEVLRHYREIVGIRDALAQRLMADPPDLFVGVDAPDFNLALESRLRQAGVRTVHFVAPSIWAWRPERVAKIKASTDHVLCVFPFEPPLLAAHGIAATYVGHPLADVIALQPDRAAARRVLGLADADTVLALLPGSRRSEIQYLAAPFFEAAARVQHARPGVRLLVPVAPMLRPQVEAAVRAAPALQHLQIVDGQSHTVLAACDATLIASGTATLEAALFKRPMVIAYRMHWLSWAIMRRKRLQPWVGLPNILLRDFAVPELLQGAAHPAAMAAECIRWLDARAEAPATITHLENRFLALHHTLRRDTARQAADAIEKILAES